MNQDVGSWKGKEDLVDKGTLATVGSCSMTDDNAVNTRTIYKESILNSIQNQQHRTQCDLGNLAAYISVLRQIVAL
jgi:hypothetical protein